MAQKAINLTYFGGPGNGFWDQKPEIIRYLDSRGLPTRLGFQIVVNYRVLRASILPYKAQNSPEAQYDMVFGPEKFKT